MIIKTYKANTNVSINVVLPSKKNLHISFTPLSNGSSTFTTDNEEIQNAIEKHYNFGKLFRLNMVVEKGKKGKKAEEAENGKKTEEDENGQKGEKGKKAEETQKGEKVEETEEADGLNEAEGQDEAETETGLKKVTVSDLAAAKDYLADKFGISRTVLRSKKAIVEQAAANGIEFEGLS